MGGSVRVPASINGCTGFMPSRGRLSPQGPPLATTVGTAGVLAVTARDAALAYAVIADRGAAPLRLPALPRGAPRLGGLRVGVFQPWFDDCRSSVRRACEEAVHTLRKRGAHWTSQCARLL